MTTVLGLDPGPNPGAVTLTIAGAQVIAAQCLTEQGVPDAIAAADLVALERFIVGRATVRRSKAGSLKALEQIGLWRDLADRAGVQVLQLPAGTVKPWATDARLRAFGCLVAGDHHRDAARHGLFAAVRTGLLPRRPVDGVNS